MAPNDPYNSCSSGLQKLGESVSYRSYFAYKMCIIADKISKQAKANYSDVFDFDTDIY